MTAHYTLRQLKTFVEVAKLESISKAAERLYVTQPAVSMQIKQLEDSFGVALFAPLGRNICLTPAGKDFLHHVQIAFAAFKDMESTMGEHAGAKRGRIDLAIVNTAKYFIPMLLVKFSELHPQIDIRLKVENKELVFGMLERNEVDLVIAGRVPDYINARAEGFASNPQGFIAHPNHPLSTQKNLTFRELAQHRFVLREPGSGSRAALERLFSEHSESLNAYMEMPSNETIKQAVMAGMGLSFLSLRTVRHELAGAYLVRLDVQNTPVMGTWQVAQLRARKSSPAVLAFQKFLKENGSNLIEAWA